MTTTLGKLYLAELEMEAVASRKCLERIPADKFSWKPHEKSMQMGYLALIVADIPKWLTFTIKEGVINFATWEKYEAKTTDNLVKRFDANMKEVREVLSNVTDEEMEKEFKLMAGDQLLATDTKKGTIGSSINHLVHHRGQLSVYMRLNDIPVPSIYGPSADDKAF